MDRSYLSQPTVIAAARAFVCVRLATYEDKGEAEMLKALCPTRSGELENTMFTLLSPDGKRELAQTSRSANHTFGDAATMVAAMSRVAQLYPPKAVAGVAELPVVRNVRLAMNIAAADDQPLVVVFAPEAGARKVLQDRLRPLAWSDRFAGRFIYVVTGDAADLASIAGARQGPGVLVVGPDRFGQKAQALKQLAASASAEELAKGLEEGAALHQKEAKTFAGHVREGHALGVFWETVLPVTDPMEQQARERGGKLGPSPK
jgi:hypothetical protein